MYKKVLGLLPVVAATLWIAGTMEQSYTEPEMITGAASLVTEPPAFVEVTELPETIAVPETTAMPEESAVPETTVPETAADPEPVEIAETTVVLETTAVPEAIITPETSAPETSEPETSAPETAAEETPEEIVVYWVKNGEVWHVRASCASLSRSKNILSGTIEEALDAGKPRVCKRCGT